MADDFSDLRAYLNLSLIGRPSQDAPALDVTTIVAAEEALARVLARRRRRRMYSALLAAGSLAAGLLAAIAVMTPPQPFEPEYPPPITAGPRGLTYAATNTSVQQALRSLADADASSMSHSYGSSASSGMRGWWAWDASSHHGLTLMLISPNSSGGFRVDARDGGTLAEDGRISETVHALVQRDPTTTSRVAAKAASSMTVDSVVTALARADCPMASSACVLSAITDFATDPAEPTPLPAKDLWIRLCSLDGVTLLGTTTDRLGRTATAVAADSYDGMQRLVLLIDPRTGRYLGTEYLDLRHGQLYVRRLVAVAEE